LVINDLLDGFLHLREGRQRYVIHATAHGAADVVVTIPPGVEPGGGAAQLQFLDHPVCGQKL
jgi:hypothetical protein